MIGRTLLLLSALFVAICVIPLPAQQDDALLSNPNEQQQAAPRFFQVPMAELLSHPIYLSTTQHNELVVKHSSSGCDLVRDDLLTHADSIRLLSGGLASFLNSGEKKVVVPVIDDSDASHGGHRLLGFVRIESVVPRKLGARRGDILYDLEEGGPAPAIQIGNVVIGPGGAKTTTDKDYTPPPRGGGACITSRDCYFGNGTCTAGLCACAGDWTGTYCQLHRPQTTGISGLLKKKPAVTPKIAVGGFDGGSRGNGGSASRADLPAPPPDEDVVVALSGEAFRRSQVHVETASTVRIDSPDRAEVSERTDASRADTEKVEFADDSTSPPPPNVPVEIDAATEEPIQSQERAAQDVQKPRRKLKPGAKRKPKPPPPAASANEDEPNTAEAMFVSTPPQQLNQQQQQTLQQQQQQKQQQAQEVQPAKPFEFEDPLVRFKRDRERREKEAQAIREAEVEEAQRKEARVREIQERARLESERRQAELDKAAREQQESQEAHKRIDAELGGGGGAGAGGREGSAASMASIEDLYGYAKPYPEPYIAGKVPRDLQIYQAKARLEKRGFIYAVRFRSGPLGLSFDNRQPSSTVVEKVAPEMQSDMSGVRAGDVLIAIDQYNVTGASAKVSQRILASLGWPRILAFEAPGLGIDPAEALNKLRLRQVNISIVYPPSLVTTLESRLAEWSPPFRLDKDPTCPVYYMQAAKDLLGCAGDPSSLAAVSEAADAIAAAKGFPSPEVQEKYPMLSMLSQEAARRQIPLDLRPMLIAKRGICTFVDKGTAASAAEASFVLIVNTDDTLMDMPSGKENTNAVYVPITLSRGNETALIQLGAAPETEVLSIIADPLVGITPICQRAHALVEEIVDSWPHSVPPISLRDIQHETATAKQKVPVPRGMTEEGGRVAVGGANGWAFFDYHLAMFGPPELPMGPHRLQFAMPPFGCDPATYTVRISGTIVAILRGGGCSFGIKVINAQKLGALAVIIVNTDDTKSMRLMALPDEVPQINIPCVMVSRRFQYLLQDDLSRYFLIDQHVVSLQPLEHVTAYEQRSARKT